jgi:hypothetical protein
LPPPELTLDALKHPFFVWAELESFRITGDKERLRLIWKPLVAYHAALKKYLRQRNGLYLTDWASMDNPSRNSFLAGGGTGVDMSAEMVLFARNLSEIATSIKDLKICIAKFANIRFLPDGRVGNASGII